jgi:hypothetical protein
MWVEGVRQPVSFVTVVRVVLVFIVVDTIMSENTMARSLLQARSCPTSP